MQADFGRARLLPSRVFLRYSGSAGASPSQLHNHPQPTWLYRRFSIRERKLGLSTAAENVSARQACTATCRFQRSPPFVSGISPPPTTTTQAATGTNRWITSPLDTRVAGYLLATQEHKRTRLTAPLNSDIFLAQRRIQSVAQTQGGISSVGRALAWHARGHRFDPVILHFP